MKKSFWLVVARIALSFVILFALYAIHFILDRTVFEKNFEGNVHEVVKILSSFIWSFIGGVITFKIAKDSKRNSLIAVAVLTLLFMLSNYSTSTGDTFFYWVTTIEMTTGVLAGGFIMMKRSRKKQYN